MKKLFLNPRFLHVFYSSVFALLCGYIYLSDVKSEEYKSIATTLHSQAEETNRFSRFYKMEFDKQAYAYRNSVNIKAQANIESIMSICDATYDILNNNVSAFQSNLEIENHFLKKTSIPTRQFFDEGKVAFLQKTIKNTVDSITTRINDPKRSGDLLQKFILYDFEKEDFRTLPTNFALAKLNQQIAALRNLELAIVFDFYVRYTGCEIKLDRFLIALSPYSAAAKVGEPYAIDMALTDYSSHASEPNITYYIDGKEISSKFGLATFTKKYNIAGKKTIRASASIKHPLTGQVETMTKEFSFEVMEK